jgi:hypothetical protein
MTEPKLGKKITGEANRDAIHIAVVPLIAGQELRPGQSFRLAYGTSDTAIPSADEYGREAIGIVDPYLGHESANWRDWRVEVGERFWGFLMPGTVTGMRHHWQHPSFDNVPIPANEHELWLRQFCDRWNFDYDELIAAGIGCEEDRYVVAQGIDLHSRGELGEDYDLFWSHLEALTGSQFDSQHREGLAWSCSC